MLKHISSRHCGPRAEACGAFETGNGGSWRPVLNALSSVGDRPGSVDDVIVGCVGQSGEQSFHVGRNRSSLLRYRKASPPSPSTASAEARNNRFTSRPRR